ncbi:hypothetical protein [Pseudomonas koreensis]|uniref:hypothetical protein n=1 Tax=Pseudomonas koreensis TaxID=198620 RepID=UPI00207786DE|nr:hypothetical protein [Pseudomonas koreensis]MCM8742334.1 hypothetical protein [Pseudomonas koreensis]
MLESSAQVLIANGHNTERFDPYRYPIKRLFRLADAVVARERNSLVTESMLQQAAIFSAFGKEGREYYNELIKGLVSDGK